MDKRGSWKAFPPSPSSSLYFTLVNFHDGLARKCLLRRYPGPIEFSRNFSPLERLALSHGEKNFKKNFWDQGNYAGCLQRKSFL